LRIAATPIFLSGGSAQFRCRWRRRSSIGCCLFTCEAGQFTLAAWLQPAGEIGGDTFDFSLERDTLHVSLTDAMGHTMDAALLATVLVGGLRNARRRGVELANQARLANDALAEQAGESQFVTGLLVRIDLARASAGIVNAGHPPPLRLRSGQVERSSGGRPPVRPTGSMLEPDAAGHEHRRHPD
jgi:serine phosphatase RsbU (regulator of sigma subunit)